MLQFPDPYPPNRCQLCGKLPKLNVGFGNDKPWTCFRCNQAIVKEANMIVPVQIVIAKDRVLDELQLLLERTNHKFLGKWSPEEATKLGRLCKLLLLPSEDESLAALAQYIAADDEAVYDTDTTHK